MFEYIAIIGLATVIKLTSSMDDMLWLPKLLNNETTKHKRLIESVYIFTLMLIVLLSYVLAHLGNIVFLSISNNQNLFGLLSSFGLILFAMLHLKGNDKQNKTNEPIGTLAEKLESAFVISFVGSVDELVIFTTVFSSKIIDVAPLMIGTVTAGMLVILVANSILRVGFIMRIVERIPIWIIVLLIGIFAFVQNISSCKVFLEYDFLCCCKILNFLWTIVVWFFEHLYISIAHLITIITDRDIFLFALAIYAGANIDKTIKWMEKFLLFKIGFFIRYTMLFIWRLGKPYWKEVDIVTALSEVNEQVFTRVFVIRVGNLAISNKNYRENIKHIIDVEHIWDWHFFTRSNQNVRDIKVWACDFFDYKDNKFSSAKDNSTTELGLVGITSLQSDSTIQTLFKRYKLDVAFDDIIIHGTIKGVASFPNIADLSAKYLDNMNIEKIVIFYSDGMHTKTIDFGQKDFSDVIIKFAASNHDTNEGLYIGEKYENHDKNSAKRLADILTSLTNINSCSDDCDNKEDSSPNQQDDTTK